MFQAGHCACVAASADAGAAVACLLFMSGCLVILNRAAAFPSTRQRTCCALNCCTRAPMRPRCSWTSRWTAAMGLKTWTVAASSALVLCVVFALFASCVSPLRMACFRCGRSVFANFALMLPFCCLCACFVCLFCIVFVVALVLGPWVKKCIGCRCFCCVCYGGVR